MAYRDTILATPGLLAYWRLGESIGVGAADERNARPAVYYGQPTLGAAGALRDDADTAVAFDGVDDYAEAPAFGDGAALTVECWVKPDAIGGRYGLVSRWITDAPDSKSWALIVESGNFKVNVATGGGGGVTTSPAPATAGEWQHVVWTFDAGTSKLYVNGALVTTDDVGSQGVGVLVPRDTPVSLGRFMYQDAWRWLDGALDEVAVYGAALTPDQVAEHYAAAFPPVTGDTPYSKAVLGTDGLMAYYRLGESGGSVARDELGQFDGTYSNITGVTFGQPGPLVGDPDTSVHLRANGYVNVPTLSPFVNGTQRTFEGWAYRDSTTLGHDALFGGSSGSTPILRVGSGGSDLSFWANSNVGAATWSGACPLARWFHWALAFDEAANTVELFIDGESVGKRSQPNAYSGTPGNLRIGLRGSLDGWNGSLDEFAVYDRILTAEEIRQHYLIGAETITPTTPPSEPPVWTWVLASESGEGIASLLVPVTPTYVRRNVTSATFTVSHDDDVAALIEGVLPNGIPQLRGYRDGALRFSGQLDNVDESAEESSTYAVVFKDPLSILLGDGSTTGRFTAAARVFTQVDQGEIAWTLIAEANADSPTGIRRGSVAHTVARDRTYEHANVGQAIIDLSNVQGGFDFDLTPLDPTLSGGDLAEFNVYPAMGQDRPEAVFEYGPGTLGNVRGVRRKTTRPVNRVRVLGQDGAMGEREDAASEALYGQLMATYSESDVSEQPTLDAKAADHLRPAWVRIVEFDPEPDVSPQPWDDYWLGDTVRLNVSRGALTGSFLPRVNALTIQTNDDGAEVAHVLTIEQGV